MLGIPSLSASSSQASPMPSPSASSCPELGVLGQLSLLKLEQSYKFCLIRKNSHVSELPAFFLLAWQILIRPSIKINVGPTYFSRPGPSYLTLANVILEPWWFEAFCIFITNCSIGTNTWPVGAPYFLVANISFDTFSASE